MKNDEFLNEELDSDVNETTEENEIEEVSELTPIPEDAALTDDDTVTDESEEDISESAEQSYDSTVEDTAGEDDDEDDDEDAAEESEITDEAMPDPEEADSSPLPANAQVKKAKPEEKVRKVDSLFDFIELFVFALVAVFIITSFFFRYSIVDGGSMQNTLQDEEKLLLYSFLYTPEPGDVVVVQDKSTLLKDPIVKRVIAVGGQTVRITRDTIYVDGEPLYEPYVYTGDYRNSSGKLDVYNYIVYPSQVLIDRGLVSDKKDGEYYEVLVPEGEIFVMGDHRNNSTDSRDIGTLHEDAVIGKVVLRFYPFDKFGKIE